MAVPTMWFCKNGQSSQYWYHWYPICSIWPHCVSHNMCRSVTGAFVIEVTLHMHCSWSANDVILQKWRESRVLVSLVPYHLYFDHTGSLYLNFRWNHALRPWSETRRKSERLKTGFRPLSLRPKQSKQSKAKLKLRRLRLRNNIKWFGLRLKF